MSLLIGIARGSWELSHLDKIGLGGMARSVAIKGVHDPLQVQVIVMQQADVRCAIVIVDAVFLLYDWYKYISQHIALNCKIDASQLCICATHSHSATATAGGVDAKNFTQEQRSAAVKENKEALLQSVVATIKEACEKLRPAEMADISSRFENPLGRNRRVKMSNGTCQTSWGAGPLWAPGDVVIEEGDHDAEELTAFAFREPGAENPFVILTSYDTHIHLYEAPVISGEGAGAARNVFEEAHPDIQLCYGNGFAGDQAFLDAHPYSDDISTLDEWYENGWQEFGERFRDQLETGLKSAQYNQPSELRCAAYQLPGRANDQGNTRRTIIQAIHLGDYAIATVPGELFISLGDQIKEKQPYKKTLFLGYNIGDHMYVPGTQEQFEEGSYEVMRGPADILPYENDKMSVKGASWSGPLIRDRTLQLLDDLQNYSS